MSRLEFNIPETLTKQLSFKRVSDSKRKLVISTNWLPLVGFEAGSPTIEKTLGKNRGIVVTRVRDLFEVSDTKTKKVYSRTYRHRKNNPIETLLDIGGQKLLSESFPADCSRVHILFEKDKITIKPLLDHQDKAIKNAKNAKDRLSAFAACSSGVDLQSLEGNDFRIHSVLDWRPRESRDKTDLTETGALAAIANSRVKHIWNEDVSTICTEMLAKSTSECPYTLFHMSTQCDDFSNLKTNKNKEDALLDISSSIDMGYDCLRLVEAMAPPSVLLENVQGWLKSDMYKIISLRMRRWGYREYVLVGDARDYGGISSRKRAYSFFTSLPSSFEWEVQKIKRDETIWPIIEKYLPECRDVTHSKSLQDGLKCGRLRTITPASLCSPTLLKSQLRMAKDSVVILFKERFYWPTEGLMKRIMGISDKFNLECCSMTIASEIIGQGVDIPLHDSVMRSIRRHLECFFHKGI